MAMIDAKVIFVVVLVTVLLASLGSWYIVLPEYLAEKKRRQQRDREKRGGETDGT